MEFICITIMCILLVIFIYAQERLHRKERDELTKKIMSKDYRDYYISELELRKLEQNNSKNKEIKTEFRI